LFAAAAALSGQPSPPAWKATGLEFERYYDLAHASLTDSEFEVELAAGRAMSLVQAMDYALNLPLQVGTVLKIGGTPGSLTKREREVTSLVAQGLSNDEIAGTLVLSKRTVEHHIANIFSKLGFNNRVQIVRWAIENGLAKASK